MGFDWDAYEDDHGSSGAAPAPIATKAGFDWDAYDDDDDTAAFKFPPEESLGPRLGRAALEALPVAGGMVGGVLGAGAAGVPTLGLGAAGGGMVGAGFGTAAGQALSNLGKAAFFPKDESIPKTVGDSFIDTGVAGLSGAAGEGVGAAAGKVIVAPALNVAKKGYGYLAGKLGGAVDAVLPRAGKALAGVPEEATKEYLDRGGNIVARESDEIIGDIKNAVAGTQAKQDAAVLSRARAKEGFDAAKQAAKDAEVAAVEELKSRSLTGLSGDIDVDVGQLRQRVSQGSTQSFDILEKAQGDIPLKPLIDKLDEAINAAHVAGDGGPALVTGEQELTVKALQDLKDRLAPFGGKVSPPNAKRILQAYDKITQYGNPGFDPAVNAAKKQARRALSEEIGERVPAYKEVMRGVSADTQLLNDLLENGFADKSQTFSTLQKISTPKGREFTQPRLEKLSSTVGSDYYDQLDRYFEAQNILQSPTAKQSFLRGIPERQALYQAGERLSQADDALDFAGDNSRRVKPFAGANANEGQITALRGARPSGAETNFENLKTATGVDLFPEARDRALLNQFKRGDPRGSAQTNLGRAVGGAVGGIVGGETGGKYGAATGAVAGFAGAPYAAPIFKAVLSGKLSVGRASQLLESSLGKYAPQLAAAAGRGAAALTTTHFLLQKTDPEFRRLNQQDQEN